MDNEKNELNILLKKLRRNNREIESYFRRFSFYLHLLLLFFLLFNGVGFNSFKWSFLKLAKDLFKKLRTFF